ncbi:TerB family tellurite resistance protein [Robertkochia solimangrovi]|uniref:TerB family tellurite resistance protein n=1 Tax=Robertkochia solimangrovi TaxID=2213046 RepID=UPI00117D987B|nr:TerB family tellurite resistance protein [Robertkochia solimangrovi]TRZ45941.1 molecular chaperone DjiA [Robertkochia solimangrovi]
MFQWIFAIVGYFLYRLPGAFIGYMIGRMVDTLQKSPAVFTTQQKATTEKVTPADFELHLLSLCSIVIKADGNVTPTELNYVRNYFVSTYGVNKANAIFRTFNEVVKKREVSAARICTYLNQYTRYPVRLQLLHFLFGIAQADGSVSKAEADKIAEIAGYLKVMSRDFESIKAMFVKSADNAYKILEVNSSATEAEVKKAYREMVKKYHPDKVRTDDEAIKKGAEEKFREVQRAYETIQKERGF